MTSRLEENKANAQAFYDLMFNQCKPREAIETYVGDGYIQHNPHVGDGKEAFIEYFERMASQYPGKVTHFKRAIAEGNFVASIAIRYGPEAMTMPGSISSASTTRAKSSNIGMCSRSSTVALLSTDPMGLF